MVFLFITVMELNNSWDSAFKYYSKIKSYNQIWDEMESAYKYASDLFYLDLSELYYGYLIVLPLTVEGEIERERLYREEEIGRYGAYEKNFTFNGVTYLAILVNNN